MTIDVFNIKESWIFTNENKPSLQLFNSFISNAEIATFTPDFINSPSAFNVEIQIGVKNIFDFKFNLIRLNSNMYYVTKDFTIEQNGTNTIITIKATLDVYLSFIMPYFDEQTTIQNPIFFKQKHMNRWMYGNNNTINYSKQYYLKNKHDALRVLGNQLEKVVDVANNSWFSVNNNALLPNNVTYQSQPLIQSQQSINGFYGYGYGYLLLTMAKNEQNQIMAKNGISWNALWNFSYSPGNNTVAWWEVLQSVPVSTYADIVVLPVAIEYGVCINGPGSSDTQNIYGWTTIDNYTKDSTLSNFYNQYVLPINPGYLAFIPTNSNGNNMFNAYNIFNEIFNIEPYVFTYCRYRIRGAGEDAFVDFTMFDNVTPSSWAITLHSFVINFNHPTTQITNLQPGYQNNNLDYMVPFGYNAATDAYWVINWKLIYPSLSNNWTNYLANNLNQYHTALNIAHYQLQNAQLGVASQILGDFMGAAHMGMGFGKTMVDLQDTGVSRVPFGIVGGIEGALSAASAGVDLAGGFNNIAIQQANYNYLKSGKEQDMSRVANERLAVNNNTMSYSNYLLSFVFEYPVMYEQIQIVNYVIYNGYIVEKWIPLNYWNNRKYCNYVKCTFFSDVLVPGLLEPYKNAIDKLLLEGIRIWNMASSGFSSPTLNMGQIAINQAFEYANVELNENNNEIIYLINT